MWARNQMHWQPGIGDPTFMGWFTVFAYALNAVLACRIALNQPCQAAGRERRIWFSVAVIMGLLCVNKQLDLQSLLTDIGRWTAYNQGWYARRRAAQETFIVMLLLGSAWLLVWVMWHFRDFWRNHRLLLCGLFFTLTFIVVRAISFHHIDEILGTHIAGVRVNWFLELGGIGIVLVAALREPDRRGRA